MAEDQEKIELEEEEHTSELTLPVLKRILGLLVPHKWWAVGFFIAIAITAGLDGLFTFINKNIIDQGIAAGDAERMLELASIYGGFIVVSLLWFLRLSI